MKDINISAKRQKKEIKVFLVCLVIAFCLNVYAIIAYDGKWTELFWSLGFVFAATVILYVVWSLFRIVVYFIRKTTTKKK